jgi:hypothetical protein
MKKATHGTGTMLTRDLTDHLRTKVSRYVTRRMERVPKHFVEQKLWEVGFALDLIAGPLDLALNPFDPFELHFR